jgi:hypothetical protein
MTSPEKSSRFFSEEELKNDDSLIEKSSSNEGRSFYESSFPSFYSRLFKSTSFEISNETS